MAVFENNNTIKLCLDDSEPLKFQICNTQNIKGYTEYVIKVNRYFSKDKCWKVYRRYNDFVALHQSLLSASNSLPLPPKKYINNLNREFIAERQAGLQKYLNLVLMNPILASSLPVRRFLDPENYNHVSFQDQALQYVSMALRGDTEFEVVKPIPNIGWRIRKNYFQVKRKDNKTNNSIKDSSKDEYILSWCEYGPDKCISDKDMQAVFKCLSTIQHPNIASFESCGSTENGAYVIRKFKPEGSLRDYIHHCKPKLPILKKTSQEQSSALHLERVVCFAYQILKVLLFLKEKGIPYGNLHTGNIIIENNDIKLLDIENGVLGVPSYYRPFFMQFRKILTLEDVDVYCFGHVLYEMMSGHTLQQPICDNFILPDNCPSQLRSVLDSILSSNACKTGLPTLEALLSMPAFSRCHHRLTERPHVKISSHVKDVLKECCTKLMSRMEEEQRMIRHQKRVGKIQEVMSAEGERKLEKRRSKGKLTSQKSVPETLNPYSNNQNNGHNQLLKRASIINDISPERSDSTSSSTPASCGIATPPNGKQVASSSSVETVTSPNSSSPASNKERSSSSNNNSSDGRSALLGSICNFDKSTLRKAKQSV